MTARAMFLRFLAQAAAMIAVGVVVNMVVDVPGPWQALRFLVSTAIGTAVVLMLWARVGRRSMQEFGSGYATFVMESGWFPWDRINRTDGDGNLAWDYSGLWILDSTGRVVSEPRRDVDPPGFYPSPHRPGQLELWSGCVWTGNYR
jgi:hypothetical protein